LERVNKSGARFDPDKTKWYNQQYLQGRSDTELTALFSSVLENKEIPSPARNDERLTKIVALIKERAVFVSDFWDLSNYFFVAPTSYNEKASRKQWKEDTPEILNQLVSVLEGIDDFSSENVENVVKAWIGEKELSFGKVMPPLRLVIVGEMKGPHIFDILEMIGKEASIQRIQTAIEKLDI